MPKGQRYKKETLTKGFTAEPKISSKGIVQVKTEIFELGIYIFIFKMGIIKDQTARKNVKRALSYMNVYAKELEADGYNITWSTEYHRISINPHTLNFKLSI